MFRHIGLITTSYVISIMKFCRMLCTLRLVELVISKILFLKPDLQCIEIANSKITAEPAERSIGQECLWICNGNSANALIPLLFVLSFWVFILLFPPFCSSLIFNSLKINCFFVHVAISFSISVHSQASLFGENFLNSP